MNKNKKWDTGKYLEKIQPEKVEYLPKDVKVRENWDHEVNYIIGTNNEAPTSASEEKEEKEDEERRPEVQPRTNLRGGIN